MDRDRLIGVGVIPVSQIEAAVRELQHCDKLGLKAIMLSTFPSGKGYPTKEDDRFWEQPSILIWRLPPTSALLAGKALISSIHEHLN